MWCFKTKQFDSKMLVYFINRYIGIKKKLKIKKYSPPPNNDSLSLLCLQLGE